MRQPYVALVVCLLLLILPAVGAEGGTIDVSDEIQVEDWPEPLRSRPGQTTEFTLTVHNTGSRPLDIYLGWTSCECEYGHSGSVAPNLITLEPGASGEVTVTVNSGDKYFGDNDGEGMLRLEWGPDLAMVDGRPDDRTVENDGDIPINVVADYGAMYTGLVVVVAIAIIAAVAGSMTVRRSRGRDPETE